MYVWRGGGGIYFIIMIKMASVFKLPDVNLYVCLLKQLYILFIFLHYTYDFILFYYFLALL